MILTRLTVCPHCSETVGNLGAHVRDTGTITARPPDACPVLFAKRNRAAK